MKKIFLIALLPVIVLLGSCKKFLNEKPYSFLSGKNFPETEEQAVIALRSCYGVMQMYYDISEVNPDYDMYMFKYRFTGALNEVNDLTQPYGYVIPNSYRGERYFRGPFVCFYKGINYANNLIATLQKRDSTVDTWVVPIIAEAKAIRAYYYFWLVRVFSDVPLKLDATTTTDINTERTPVPEIYKQIVTDLKYAEDKLPNHADPDGRITKGGCKGILAQVYLTMAGWRRTPDGQNVPGDPSNWALARDKAKEVLDMGVYTMASDYTQFYKDMAEDIYNPETIFDIPFTYNNTTDDGSNWPYFFGPASETGADPKGGGKNGGWKVQIEWLRELEPADKRIEWNIAKYYYKSQSWDKVYYTDSSEWEIAKYRKWPDNNDDAGYYWANYKYNFPLVRISEMKLIYAEAANEANGGPTTEAYQQINDIRRRAGLTDLSGLTQDQFRSHIMNERSIEFLGDGVRHLDLVRWGKFKEMMNRHRSAQWVVDDGTIDEKFINGPIPQEELDLNHWTQNK